MTEGKASFWIIVGAGAMFLAGLLLGLLDKYGLL